MDNFDPVGKMLIDANWPREPGHHNPERTTCFMFPMRAPKGSIVEGDRSAVETMDHIKTFYNHWCDHNVSATVTVKEDEWPEVGGWVWRNFDKIGGISFLPKFGAVYIQPPYEAVDESTIRGLEDQADIARKAIGYDVTETKDNTIAARELACTANGCETI